MLSPLGFNHPSPTGASALQALVYIFIALSALGVAAAG
jgi:hypothetical protein